VREVLESRGAALCWADVESRPVTPLWRTTDWGYVRFHVGRARAWPHYGRQALETWVHRIADTWSDAEDVYAYFNNDPTGAAVEDAMTFARVAGTAGLEPTRTPKHLLAHA
jgi:uncharacterized protein YecE (DUF72 family)